MIKITEKHVISQKTNILWYISGAPEKLWSFYRIHVQKLLLYKTIVLQPIFLPTKSNPHDK